MRKIYKITHIKYNEEAECTERGTSEVVGDGAIVGRNGELAIYVTEGEGPEARMNFVKIIGARLWDSVDDIGPYLQEVPDDNA